MRSPLRPRSARILASAGLVAALVLPAASHAAAADPVILRAGTLQDLDSLNPYQTALETGDESYLLSYNVLVDFGTNLEPVPGFADTWQRAADGKSWSFHIRDGMKWSDGTPATSADACFSYQLDLDAIKAGTNVGLGYIDPNLKDAGITAVSCPDPQTMIITSSDPSTRILQTGVPILPKHIWGGQTYKQVGDAKFDAPLVGTGPYQAVEWKTGEYIRFKRNPNYWGTQGAADEVIIQFFGSADTMVQALKAGEIDYARGVNSDQFTALKGQPNIQPVNGTSNGWTEIGFNTYGTGTGKTIKDGGPSTKALQDPAFRDALGYAVDKQTLLDKVVGGYGTLGTGPVPPVLTQWYSPPNDVRTFDLAVAAQKLDAAGYHLDASGHRLDKEGKPINLRLVMPNTNSAYPKIAQFVVDWWGKVGVKVTSQVYDSDTLTNLMLPPEAGKASNKANYDLFIWDWGGVPDPNGLLQIFNCDAIGGSSDSMWCDQKWDALYAQQNAATTVDQRKSLLAEMQQYWYDQAPYHIVYYDSELHAYRTDRFTGWTNQPSNGTPLFTYGTLGYTKLTLASAASPSASASSPAGSAGPSGGSSGAPATPAPSPSGDGSTSSGSSSLLLVAVVAVVVVVVGGLVLRRRRGSAEDDE